MIIAKITDQDTSDIFYIGEEECRVDDSGTLKHWKPYLINFSPTQRRIDKIYGGMVRLSGQGSIEISPISLNWPPPLKITVVISDIDQYGRVTLFFECVGYIKNIKEGSNVYTLYNKEYDVNLLDDAPDFPDTSSADETNRVYPLVIGTVNCVLPIRIGNDTTESFYHKAGITGTDPTKTGGDYDVFDTGYQREKYGVGVGTIIDATTYFKSVLASDGTTLNPPVTEFRITGTNSNITTLSELFSWSVSRINTELGTSYSLNTDNARSPSPNLNYFVTEQQNIFDFLSSVCSWCTHLFYIDEVTDEIVLVDMFDDNGTLSISDSDGNFLRYISNDYEYPEPLKRVKCEWTEFSAGLNSDGYALFFQRNKSQEVLGDNLIGKDENIIPYSNNLNDITDALTRIGKLLQYPRITVEIPITEGNINPGLNISWTDSRLIQKSTVSMRVNTIQYIPIKPNYKITAEGYAYG